jgi:hypothetical protein
MLEECNSICSDGSMIAAVYTNNTPILARPRITFDPSKMLGCHVPELTPNPRASSEHLAHRLADPGLWVPEERQDDAV